MPLALKLLAGACMGTVLTQMIIVGVCLARGTLNVDTATKMIGLLNGIDITGNQLQLALRQAESVEQPDFDEILHARAREGLDMDLRLRSQSQYHEELQAMLAQLQEQRDRFDRRRDAFALELEALRKGAEGDGMREVQRTLQALPAEQAKDQLLRIYDDGRIDDVVNIVQAMGLDKRKDILAEFVTEPDADKLHELLRRISEGEPTRSLIEQAGEDR